MRVPLVWAVARTEWRERSRSTLMRVVVCVLALLGALSSFAANVQFEPIATTRWVGVVGVLPAGVAELLDPPAKLTISFVTEPDRPAAEAGVRSGRLAAAVVDGTVLVRSRPSSLVVVLLQRALPRAAMADRLQSAGVGHDEAIDLGALPPAPVAVLSAPSPRRRLNTATAKAGAAGGGALVFSMVMFISTGIQEERGRAIADVLLVPLSGVEVVAGKVIGLVGQGLAVLAAVAVPAAAIACAYHGANAAGQVVLTVAAVVFWFVLQLAFYGCVAVVIGARSPSPEEAGGAATLSAIVGGSAAAAAVRLASTSPGGLVATIASFLPPTAAPFMLVRAAAGTVAPWQVIVAASLMLVTIAGMAWLAGLLYVGGVVVAGERLRLRDAYWICSGRPPPRRPPGLGEGGDLPAAAGDDRAGGPTSARGSAGHRAAAQVWDRP